MRERAAVPGQLVEAGRVDVPREEPVRVPRVAREEPLQILGLQVAGIRLHEVRKSAATGDDDEERPDSFVTVTGFYGFFAPRFSRFLRCGVLCF